MPRAVIAPIALLPEGWAEQVLIEFGRDGRITRVEAGAAKSGDADHCQGPVLPGMPNLHSHAFQRAMAGLAEVALNPEDSFWTWRDLMYRLVGRLTPEQVEDIARYLYIDMLKGGYTAVAEFHYLHHGLDGKPYADPAEMSRRVLRAAERAGIGITLLPVLYAHGGFGGKAPSDAQKRFINTTDQYLKLQESLAKDCAAPGRRLGFCFHSLRAVTGDEIKSVMGSADDDRPVHVHIAEQQKEVADCLAWSGRRPIQWLYDHVPVDERWCLIHATHAEPDEVAAMAKSRAVAGLCPTTEANLGDGLFPAIDFVADGGRLGIGSDSHVSLSVVEELRWLEYGQRLKHERRNRLHDANKHVAGYLYRASLQGGAQALGQKMGAIAVGNRADLVVLDGQHPLLAHVSGDDILGRWLFAGLNRMVKDVMVGGEWVVQDGRHGDEIEAGRAFAAAVKAAI
ncbi:formimidoylglutamate deiminase [Dongia sp.]|uniref:formimidoylglutamate deiminase n=1 Tax=Dongia sp. TaxID=1977262 RepID=UPI0035ADA394